MGDPSNCKFQKTTFQSLKSCFLIFPSRHPSEQAVSFSGAFPLQLRFGQISKKKSGPEKLFFDFPLQTPLRAGSELFRCFSSCPKRSCNGSPTGKFQKKTFQGLKSCFFDFPFQTPLRAGSELFRCFSSCPKRSCNGRPFQLANFKRKLFRASDKNRENSQS